MRGEAEKRRGTKFRAAPTEDGSKRSTVGTRRSSPSQEDCQHDFYTVTLRWTKSMGYRALPRAGPLNRREKFDDITRRTRRGRTLSQWGLALLWELHCQCQLRRWIGDQRRLHHDIRVKPIHALVPNRLLSLDSPPVVPDRELPWAVRDRASRFCHDVRYSLTVNHLKLPIISQFGSKKLEPKHR